MTIKTTKVICHSISLKDYCILANEHNFIEVINWRNGEGKDITINNCGEERTFKLTHGEFQALSVLFNYEGE
jgi:predicted mannosyl-3-phosphoglycerate phosphatase (HAD superfamily)